LVSVSKRPAGWDFLGSFVISVPTPTSRLVLFLQQTPPTSVSFGLPVMSTVALAPSLQKLLPRFFP
jgi:hypothetical protein